MPYLENHFRKQNADRSKKSTEFLFAADPQVRPCERAPPYRLREVRKHIEERGLVPGGFDQNKGRQPVYFTLVNALGSNPNKKYKAHKHFKSLYGAINVVDMDGAQKKILKFHQNAQWLHCLFRHDPKEYMKKVVHIRDRANAKARIRGSVAHTLSKRTPVITWWSQTKEYFLCTGYRPRYLAEVLQGTQCATEVPHNSGISLYQQKKIDNASSCQVKLKR